MIGITRSWFIKLVKHFFIITAVFLFGCGHSPACRHAAVYYASVAAEKYPVRIALGPTATIGEWHCQAQAKKNGKWYFLKSNILGTIELYRWQDKNYRITEYMSLSDFFNRYIAKERTNDQKK